MHNQIHNTLILKFIENQGKFALEHPFSNLVSYTLPRYTKLPIRVASGVKLIPYHIHTMHAAYDDMMSMRIT